MDWLVFLLYMHFRSLASLLVHSRRKPGPVRPCEVGTEVTCLHCRDVTETGLDLFADGDVRNSYRIIREVTVES